MDAAETLKSISMPDKGRSLDAHDEFLKRFAPAVLNLPVEDFVSPEEKWDRRFLALAEHISEWSKDPSTKVGAVIVNDRREIVGTGYNGFARGVSDDEVRYHDRPTKYKLVVHAEQNAILTAGERARGGTIYVTPSFSIPNLCSTCAKLVIQAGIVRVVGWEPEVSDEVKARWAEELEAAKLMCDEAGVEYVGLVR